MTQWKRSLALMSASALVSVVAILVSAQAQQPLPPDPERAFSFADSDLDGKLSFAEYHEQAKNAPRMKKAGLMTEPIFQKLDINHDGFLTLEEYREVFRMMGPGPGGGLGKGAFAKAKRAAATPRPPKLIEVVTAPISPDQVKFFEAKIRPVLINECSKCHSAGADKVKGGLLVDSREGLRQGGDTGPAIVVGNPDDSLLIQAIRYRDDALKMPPKTQLPANVVADFEEWVRMGAPDPREGESQLEPRSSVDIDKGREFWAFQPPRHTPPPLVRNTNWPKSSIDRFILAALEAKGLTPVGDANKPTLIRRVTFDLSGLPPTAEEVETFVDDASEDAFAKVVDRLLASPRFGERWGRHWLDVARYAESSGKVNFSYPQAWRYRNWVIAAFNEDKPYNQFVREQIAGDLLPAKNEREQAEHLIATAFLAIGSKIHNTQNRTQFLVDLADEQIDVTSQAFLGLTVACARCHDHKFDPIPQRDYYALSGIFQSTQTCYGTLGGVIGNINPSPLIELPADSGQPSALVNLPAERRTSLETQIADLVKTRDDMKPEDRFTMKGIQTNTRLALLRYKLASYQPDGTPRNYTMGVREREKPVNSPFYVRGELEQPGEAVPRGLVQVINSKTADSTATKGSGRRELADWLAAETNPLTARVMINRVWLHLFGRGLVPTPDNFGAAGQPPSHPELLDSLALSFMEQGWSIKQLIRRIVLSQTYQLASTHEPHNDEIDPDNTLIWRMSKRRLEAEAVRDALLAISGRLNLVPPVGTPVAKAGEGPTRLVAGFMGDVPETYRSVYLPVIRDQLPESLALFDFADPTLVAGERATTSGPSQALFLMNSPFIARQADSTADRLKALESDENRRLEKAYLLIFARNPTSTERDLAKTFIQDFAVQSKDDDPQRAAWSAFCQAMFASAEARYLD